MATDEMIEAAQRQMRDVGLNDNPRILGLIIDAALPLAGERQRELEALVDEQLKRIGELERQREELELIVETPSDERAESKPAGGEATNKECDRIYAAAVAEEAVEYTALKAALSAFLAQRAAIKQALSAADFKAYDLGTDLVDELVALAEQKQAVPPAVAEVLASMRKFRLSDDHLPLAATHEFADKIEAALAGRLEGEAGR